VSEASRRLVRLPAEPEPTWEVALLFPPRGRWSQEDYLTLLALAGKRYAIHGEFAKRSVAASALLPDFAVNVAAAFAHHLRGGAGAPRKRKGRP
jgi:hypothetical protein